MKSSKDVVLIRTKYDQLSAKEQTKTFDENMNSYKEDIKEVLIELGQMIKKDLKDPVTVYAHSS